MTGPFKHGDNPGQREKVWAIMRARGSPMSTMDIVYSAANLPDPKINKIRVEPVRRCLQELRDMNPPYAKKIDLEHWVALDPTDDMVKAT